ncbi:hypothetical protein [Piscinibacter sp. XHJ-5]|uniref:hypothetical protein n=1 Tax=Piscinibacter sp. XHJ-5 TaxID=3037797 RepID=UPI002453364E|nr:hypothetical protein [Piscinibacter sp. XHJ-5]
MPRAQPDFEKTYVFGWDAEPHDERPSEFAQSSGYTVLSGYHHPSDVNARAARRRQGSGIGFKGIVIACALLLGTSGWAIYEAMKLLRA